MSQFIDRLCLLLGALFIRIKPDFRIRLMDVRVELYRRPWTKLRWLRADALILPVTADAWIGKFIERAIRDAGGDVIQESLKRGGPLPQGQVRVVPAGKLWCKRVIVANIYDSTSRTSHAAVAVSFDAAVSEAVSLGAKKLMFADFSAEFEYSGDRQASSFAARAIVDTIVRNREKVSEVAVFILQQKNLAAYVKALKETHHYTPAVGTASEAEG